MDLMPPGAQSIVDLRKQGKAPASWVLVSFSGWPGVRDDGATIVVDPTKTYEWRWVLGLDVIVFSRKGQPVAHHLKAIRNAAPNSLAVWDVERKCGADVFFDWPPEPQIARQKYSNRRLPVHLLAWSSYQNKEMINARY